MTASDTKVTLLISTLAGAEEALGSAIEELKELGMAEPRYLCDVGKLDKLIQAKDRITLVLDSSIK